MTILGTRAPEHARDMSDLRPGGPATDDLVVQLRESAGRMVPFSQPKILLRAAASAPRAADTDARNWPPTSAASQPSCRYCAALPAVPESVPPSPPRSPGASP
jgi:hypothetical protein